MAKTIYGIDTSKIITPAMVRDAIIDLFIIENREIFEQMKELHKFKSQQEYEEMKRLEVKILVKSKFDSIGADFNKPKKEDLIKVYERLSEYATHFWRPGKVKEHYKEIMKLINKLK